MTAKKELSNFEIVNGLFPKTPVSWNSRINTESKASWEDASLLLSSDEYQAERNEIFSALINRIASVVIKNRNFSNPLSMFKKGLMPFGDTIQEIASDVIEASEFKPGKSDQFEYTENDVKAVYHRINRQQFYKRTIDDSLVQRAFTSENGLQQLINVLVNGITGSNTVDEFLFTKKAIADVVNLDKEGKFKLQDTQILNLPDIRKLTRKTTDIHYFIEQIKTVMRLMQFPNRKYTLSAQMQQTNANDMVLLLNADIVSINEVNNLSQAFKPEYMNLDIPVIALDNLSDDESIVGCIMSKDALNIRNTKEVTRYADNARSLYTNIYYHIHQIYAVSPFETMVFLKVK